MPRASTLQAVPALTMRRQVLSHHCCQYVQGNSNQSIATDAAQHLERLHEQLHQGRTRKLHAHRGLL